MCGIFGATGLENDQVAAQALLLFKYRGPDHTGHYFGEGVFIGTNRLSIIDLDHRSDQPIFNEAKTVGVVFNGEIYNFRELQTELKQQGIQFRTESDTEVILRLYEKYGSAFVSRLRGMFAFAIYDKVTGKISLFRDHAGIKPLYYAYDKGELRFSSELKGVTMLKSGSALSSQAFVLASVLGYIPSPLTMYEDIFKLERGAMLIHDLKTGSHEIVQHAYKYEESQVTTIESLTELIEQKVLSHLVGDVPVGLFFSGGTDSSLIAAILKKYQRRLNAYAIIMSNKQEDAHYIDVIGKKLDLNVHKVNFAQSEFDQTLAELKPLIDEPTLDSSLFVIHHLSKVAAKDVKVVLSGEGADEFFFGYKRHLPMANGANRKLRDLSFLDPVFSARASFKGKRTLFMRLYEYFNDLNSYYLLATGNSHSAQGWRECRQFFKDFGNTNPLLLDQDFYLENDLLRKNDLGTSYASIEGRVPFLDPDIITASKHFQSEFRNGTMLKPVLKKVLTNYLPDELVYRKKSGLGPPVRSLFRNSDTFRVDLQKALEHLRSYDELYEFIQDVTADFLIDKEPAYAFFLVTYYYALCNTQQQ